MKTSDISSEGPADMSKPRQPQEPAITSGRADSRAAILKAARTLLLDRGYDDVSMDDIAVLAGVARQTVFNRFGSKDAVFRAMVSAHWETWGQGIRVPRVPPDAPVEDQLRAIALSIVAFQDSPEQIRFQRLVVSESRRLDWIGPAAFRSGKGPHMEALAQHLARLHEQGRLRCEKPMVAAWQFVALIQEFLVWPKVMSIGDAAEMIPSTEEVIDEAIRTFMARYGD
jgi:TetR/AcrR family transcriptional regulator of autoinduction and epiphytic fitness